MPESFDISHEVSCALNRNAPVVALESSVIAQGLPKPTNLDAASAMEEAVSSAGAVPAIIGVIGGRIRVGLTRDEVETLARGKAEKVAVRDLPYVVANKLDGGMTVSATIRVAAAAGIPVVATGGVGGVHRNFAQTLDISADLVELSRTPVLVVCSGPKAVLDIPATAEWLETYGVPIYGFQTDELPAFYTRSTGISIPRLDDADAVASIAKAAAATLGMRSAILVAVPVPKSDALDVSPALKTACEEAERRGVRGKELTPFLLQRIADLTKGRSLESNLALLRNNARVAAQIALAMAHESQQRMGFRA